MIVPSRTFQRQFDCLDASVRQRVVEKVEKLDDNLHIWRHERLQGRPEFKLRVGDWRVLYQFNILKKEVYLLTIRHRRDVYR